MLGDRVHIARNATVGPQVVLGDGVRVEAERTDRRQHHLGRRHHSLREHHSRLHPWT